MAFFQKNHKWCGGVFFGKIKKIFIFFKNHQGFALLEFLLALSLSSLLFLSIFQGMKLYKNHEKKNTLYHLSSMLHKKLSHYFLQNLHFPPPSLLKNTKEFYALGYYPQDLFRELKGENSIICLKDYRVVYGVARHLMDFPKNFSILPGKNYKEKLCGYFFSSNFSHDNHENFTKETSPLGGLKKFLNVHGYEKNTYVSKDNYCGFFIVIVPKSQEKIFMDFLLSLSQEKFSFLNFSDFPNKTSQGFFVFSQENLYSLLGSLELSCNDILYLLANSIH